MDTFAGGALIFLTIIAFNNYREGTLGDWLKAKFLNASDPVSGDSPFEATQVSTAGAASTGPSGGGLGALLAPVVGKITGTFGEQRSTHKHAGIDYAVAIGTPVKAARAGVIKSAGNQQGYGLTVVIDHGGGAQSLYGHLSSIKVRTGQTVKAGDVVALSGNSGQSTGPHVHFEVRENGKAVDPKPYLGGVASVGAALTA